MRRAGIAHAHRELGQFVALRGQQVRLQVEHDLQAMLDLAQEAVVVFEDRPFLVRQAAGLLELGDGVERVAGADLGQGAAVEELQELDHELDVADAAVAGLHVPQVGPFALGALLDPPLERLDAGDVGRGSGSGDRSRARAVRGTRRPGRRSPAIGRAFTYACRSQVRPFVS